MKIIIYSAHHFEKSFLENAANNKHELLYSAYPLNSQTAKLAKGCQAVSLFTSCVASAEVVQELFDLGVRFISLRSAGYNHVDLEKANQLGIKVANVPFYSPFAIAEHAVTLLMALNRKLLLGQKLMKKNNFSLDQLVGEDLHGKTVGIVGTGNIGAAFATIMKGFGCRLLAFDPVENKQLVYNTGVTYTNLEDLCEQSDVISVHCPLTKETNYLFNKKLFDKMKKEVFFINASRGAIVKTIDLIEALKNNTIGGTGLDVYENEKDIFFTNHNNTEIVDELFEELRNLPNVIITGHQAFLTKEALAGIAETTIKNCNQWEAKGFSENDLTIK
jgi:D-lactate dehydrogenase